MGYWLVKSEPSVYSYEDLVRDKQTVWDGVRNSLAQRHLRAMARGDLVLIYHSGKERAVVGIATVVSTSSAAPGGGEVLVELKPEEKLGQPIPLTAIKADPAFADFPLVRLSRLSVMPVATAQWKALVAKGRS
jgi:predicted RNA-binding protein with PUA-like domain